MKKKVLLLASVLSLACAANSFAAAFEWLVTAPVAGAAQTISVTGNLPTISLKVSSNVVAGYAKHATGASYSLGAYHISGTFSYATASTEASIYRKENTSGNATQSAVAKGPAAPADATDSDSAVSAYWVANSWTVSK